LPPSQVQRGRPQNVLAVFDDVLDPEIRDVDRIDQLIEESLGQIFNVFSERGNGENGDYYIENGTQDIGR